MIGWRAKTKFLSSIPDYTGVDPNSIQYDDANSVFPIYKYLGETDYVTTDDMQVAFNFLLDKIGEDAYRLYSSANGYIDSVAYNELSLLIPSFTLISPNSFSKLEEQGSFNRYNGFLYYIESLNKLVVFGTLSASDIYVNATVYDTTTGSCAKIFSSSINFELSYGIRRTATYRYQLYFMIFNGDLSKSSDIELSSNYNGILISNSNTPGPYYAGLYKMSIVSDSSKNFYKAVFRNYADPDFNFRPDNPYEPGGSSGEDGGGGSFDDESDIITIPTLPTISSADTGFTRIYNPTLAQVQTLARYLWTEESVIETIWNHIKQYFENPMEAIIGFNLVPVPVPNGGTTTFKLMYIDTGVSMTAAANQFVDVDCGTLELKEYYGSALDYSPFTKISCFLPYIGNISLNVDEVMGRTLGVKYRVDICSGACVAYITVDGNAIYQYSGHCAIPIPISAADFSNYVTATISTAKLAAAGITAGVGVAAGMMAEDPSPQTNQIVKVTKQVQTARNPATGRQITTGTTTTTVEKPTEQDNTNASFAGLAPQNIANTVGTIMGSKPHIEHSGSFSGNSGYLGVRRPFVIIQRPNMCMPSNYQQLNGFPSMITMALSDCKGFTRVQQVQLTGLQATNPEQAEIMQLLKTGVIL